MKREAVEFDAEGCTLRGILFTPESPATPAPAVAMSHGFAGTKEMGLLEYAECFVASGLAVLVYDNRTTGESDGLPRHDLDAVAQRRDYSAAVSFLRSRPEVDGDRIGVWGTSYSGGTALAAAALDPRIGCVVCQVPLIAGYENIVQLMPLQQIDTLYEMIEADRVSRAAGNTPGTAPICAPNPEDPCIFPGRRTYDYYHAQAARHPDVNWKNEVTIRTLEYLLEYDVTPYMKRISPTPMLMIAATEDVSTPTGLALDAYALAREPKQLVLIKGDHYQSYVEQFEVTSSAARDWFLHHLGN
ncbi:MAG: alpha/beta hydrolase [Pseudomonadales bacterium]